MMWKACYLLSVLLSCSTFASETVREFKNFVVVANTPNYEIPELILKDLLLDSRHNRDLCLRLYGRSYGYQPHVMGVVLQTNTINCPDDRDSRGLLERYYDLSALALSETDKPVIYLIRRDAKNDRRMVSLRDEKKNIAGN
jgi:hypothetical protein